MGKGDIKTKRGKIANQSFGKKRPHKVKEKAVATQQVEKVTVATKPTKKTKK